MSEEESKTTVYKEYPYEIRTRASADVDSKGNIKPNATAEIVRRIEDEKQIKELMKADSQYAAFLVETMIAEIKESYEG